MNTDNISVAGLTLDYGPYSFMDVYDNAHICNHTDEEGRYAFKVRFLSSELANHLYSTSQLLVSTVSAYYDVSLAPFVNNSSFAEPALL